MTLGHLVEDAHALAIVGRILDRQLDAAHGVLDVDEGARLAAGAVHRQRVADRGLHQEAVQHGAVVAVVVEAVDQPLVEPRLVGLRAPDDPLVEVGDPHAVVLVVEREQQLIERLRHVVDAARVGRVQDLLLDLGAARRCRTAPQVALGNRHAGGAVAVDAHRAEVDDVGVEPGLDDRRQQVVRGVDVVVDRVALVPRALHRVRRRALLGEVHDRVGLVLVEQVEQLAGSPRRRRTGGTGSRVPVSSRQAASARSDRLDRRQRLGLELVVGVAPREVVDDRDVVAAGGEMQRRRPATEAVSTENQDAQ